jgi:hypothetical protein
VESCRLVEAQRKNATGTDEVKAARTVEFAGNSKDKCLNDAVGTEIERPRCARQRGMVVASIWKEALSSKLKLRVGDFTLAGRELSRSRLVATIIGGNFCNLLTLEPYSMIETDARMPYKTA